MRGQNGEQGVLRRHSLRSSVSQDTDSSTQGAAQPSPVGVVDPNGVIQKSHGKLAGVGVPGKGPDGAAGPGGRNGEG